MSGPLGRAAAVVTAVAALALVAGCGGLTTHSGVQNGLDVGSGGGSQVRVIPPGPVDGADRDQIVRGFIRAGSASDGDYDAARSFLTEPMAKQWSPDGQIVILSNEASLSLKVTGPATGVVTAEAEAVLAPDGRYTTLAPGSRRSAAVGFAKIAGQWRIADLPKDFGRWLNSADVPRLLRPYALHFVATDRSALVSDVRWFPLDRLTTRLARAQLEDVPAYLAGAASSRVPKGARLLADGVPVVDGVATVDLSARVPTDQAVREGLWAQFVATLTQVPGVLSVALRVDGAALDLPGVGSPVGTISVLGFEPESLLSVVNPLLRQGSTLTVLGDGTTDDGPQAVAPGGAAYPQIPASVTDLALSSDGEQVAGVDPGRAGLSVWRGSTRTQYGGIGGQLGDPSFDRLGYLWVGGVGARRSPATRLWVVDTEERSGPAGQPTPVGASWLEGRRVVESKVAPDGQRLVVLSTDAAGLGARLDVAGIVRGVGGRPDHLADPLRLGGPVTGFVGLAWLDNETLTTLGGATPVTLRPYVIGLGGDVRGLSRTPNGVAVACPGGERAIRVVTAADEVLARTGPRWFKEADGSDVLVAGR